jgi:putative ABC transport system permease protein
LFLCEALFLAIVGVGLGLPLGRWLASSVVKATAQTVETFYIAAVAETTARTMSWKPLEVLLTVVVALSLAMVAAAIPAFGAAKVDPISVIRRIDSFTRRRAGRYPIVFASISTLLAWLCTRLPPIHGQPAFGFLAELLFMMAVACCVPLILTVFCRLARWLAANVGPVEGRLAVANLWAAVPQTSISVAALAMSLSMMIAIGVMVGSFRETVVYWLDSVLHADLVVKPVMNSSSLSSATISPAAASALKADTDVDTACWYTSRQIPYRDSFVRLDTSDLDALLKHSRIMFKRPRDGHEQVLKLLAAQQPFAIVSESFSLLYKKRTGDEFELPTPKGPVRLPIVGVYYDYSSNLGTVLLDFRWYHAYFDDNQPARSPMGMSLFLKPGTNAEQTRKRLSREFADGGQSLYIVTNKQVHDEALRIFDSTFTITYALQTIAIIIAGAGIVSTLIRLIYERRREIGLLGLLGATAAQIRRMVVVEAALLGIVSHLTGTALGILLSLVLIYVINVQSFGWTIQFHLPIGFLLQSFIAVVAASILFGLYPANREASTDALTTVRTT